MATAYKPAAMKTVPPDAALLSDCASVSEKPVFENRLCMPGQLSWVECRLVLTTRRSGHLEGHGHVDSSAGFYIAYTNKSTSLGRGASSEVACR